MQSRQVEKGFITPVKSTVLLAKVCGFFMLFMGITLGGAGVSLSYAHSYHHPPKNLYKGLIAEDASGKSMYAIACVVRNRLNKGMNPGLCGLKRRALDKFVRREGRKTEHLAKAVVKKVFIEKGKDITGGATHYEAVERYGLPYWAVNMQPTIKIGEHQFFK